MESINWRDYVVSDPLSLPANPSSKAHACRWDLYWTCLLPAGRLRRCVRTIRILQRNASVLFLPMRQRRFAKNGSIFYLPPAPMHEGTLPCR
jgi:hypothetical protein